jgi:hypothetical protein
VDRLKIVCDIQVELDQRHDVWRASVEGEQVEIAATSRDEALTKAEAWALRRMADRVENRETRRPLVLNMGIYRSTA